MQITSDLYFILPEWLIKDVGCKKTERDRDRDRDRETEVVVLLLMGMNKAQCFACPKEREQPTHLDDKRSLLDMDSFTL